MSDDKWSNAKVLANLEKRDKDRIEKEKKDFEEYKNKVENLDSIKTKKKISKMMRDPNLPTIHSLGGGHYEMEGREFSDDIYSGYDSGYDEN